MILRSRKASDLPYSEVTPERIYRSRREFLQTTAVALGAAAGCETTSNAQGAGELRTTRNAKYTAADKPNTFEQITTYNNFYEFGTGKGDPARYAGSLKTKPWTVKVDGLVGKPGDYGVED